MLSILKNNFYFLPFKDIKLVTPRPQLPLTLIEPVFTLGWNSEFAILCSKGSTATVTTLQTAMYIDEVRNVIIKATNAGPDDDIIFLPPSSYMATPSLYFVTEICERLYVNEPVVFASEQTDEAELRSVQHTIEFETPNFLSLDARTCLCLSLTVGHGRKWVAQSFASRTTDRAGSTPATSGTSWVQTK